MKRKWRRRGQIYHVIAALLGLAVLVFLNSLYLVSTRTKEGEDVEDLEVTNTAQLLVDHQSNNHIKKEQRIAFSKSQQQQQLQQNRRQVHCIDHNNQTWDLPAVPDFVIIGVQKGGTTALRNLLVKHPSMVASQEFERHFFDKKLFRYLQKIKNYYHQAPSDEVIIKEEWICDIRRHYIQSTWHEKMLELRKKENLEEEEEGGLFFYEKTPSYIVDPDVPLLIHKVCPWTKIVVILRDPIQRAYSHYKMEREKLRIKVDFTTAVQQEIHHLRQYGLSNAVPPPSPPPPQAEQQDDGKKEKDDKDELFSFQIPVTTMTDDDAHKKFLKNYTNLNFLHRGMYSIQLKRWLKYFSLDDNKLLVLKFEDLQTQPVKVYERILDFLGAPTINIINNGSSLLSADDFNKSYQTRGQYRRKGIIHSPITNETKRYLEKFFQPYNDQLEQLLGTKFY